MTNPTLGLIGVGLMGHGIASNLVKHGHTLVVLEHPGNQPLDALRAAGVRTAATPAELARQVDVLFLCVTGTPQVEAVLQGPDGALSTLRAGAVVIDCSTALPDSTVRMAQAVALAGGRFLDAPMTRTPKEAAEGRLNLLVGGDAALFAECRPLLACFAENITHAGAVGAGHQMKLLHNYVSLGMVSLLAEAASGAMKAGIAMDTFVEVLAKGGGAGVGLERIRQHLLTGDPTNMRFSIANAHKDLSYFNAMADAMGADHTIAAGVLATLERAVHDGAGARFIPELVDAIGARH